MDRREFVKMAPAFAGATVSASLVLKEEGKPPVDLDVSVLRVKPGDIVVLACDEPVPSEMASYIRDKFEQAFPGLKAMVLSGGMSVEGVIRPELFHVDR